MLDVGWIWHLKYKIIIRVWQRKCLKKQMEQNYIVLTPLIWNLNFNKLLKYFVLKQVCYYGMDADSHAGKQQLVPVPWGFFLCAPQTFWPIVSFQPLHLPPGRKTTGAWPQKRNLEMATVLLPRHFSNYRLACVHFQKQHLCAISPPNCPFYPPSVSLILCHTCPPGPPATCPTQPWLDAHGPGALGTQKLAAGSECRCIRQRNSWRSCTSPLHVPSTQQGPHAEWKLPPRATTSSWEGKSDRRDSVDKGAVMRKKIRSQTPSGVQAAALEKRRCGE